MQIKISDTNSTKNNTIELIGKSQTVKIITNEIAQSDLPADKSIFVLPDSIDKAGTNLSEDGFLIISTPGEYEQQEIFISAHVNDVNTSTHIDVIEIEMDGVRFLYYSAEAAVTKESMDSVGIVDVMVINIAENISQQLKSVNAFDPRVLIPYTNSNLESLEKFKSEVGITFTKETKVQFKQADFLEEEYILHGVEIE